MNTLAGTGTFRSARRQFTRRTVAIVLVLAMALPVRIWLPLGSFASFAPVDVLLLASPFLLLVFQSYSLRLPIGRKSIALLLMLPVIACVASLVWSVDLAATMRASVVYAEAMVAYVFTVALLCRLPTRTIANLVALFLVVVIAVSVASMFRLPGLGPQVPTNLSGNAADAYRLSYYARLSNPYIGLSNNLATVLAFFPFLLASYARVTGYARYRWMALLCVAAVCMTLSRGVVLALALTYALWIVANAPRAGKKALQTLSYLAVVAIALFIYLQVNSLADQHLAGRLSMANVTQRLDTQAAAISAIVAHPAGLGGGIDLSAVTGGAVVHNTHNAFVQQLFYFGIVGGVIVDLALLLLPVVVVRWRLRSVQARMLRSGLVYSLITMLVVFAFEASFEGSVLRVLFYFSVALGVALIVATEREATQLVSQLPSAQGEQPCDTQ